MFKLNNLFLFTILTPLITSCNGGGKSAASTTSTFVANQLADETVNLDSDQIKIATRICYAYESKSNNFHSTDYQKYKYNFSVQNTGCTTYDQYNIQASLLEKSNSDTVYFSTTSTKQFYSTIQTHDSGYLIKVCDKIKNNESISNTATTGNIKTQIYFYNDGSDAYILKYFTLSGSTYKATSSETFKVRTQYNYQSGTIMGMDEVYSSSGICTSNASRNYSFSQSYTGKN